MKTLKKNFLKCLSGLNTPEISHLSLDATFQPDNWLINFPFNFYHNSDLQESNLIRKLSLTNALYCFYILREDDVFDEYHLPKKVFRRIIIAACHSRQLRNMAIGQLLHLCGTEIYPYVFRYEKKYYNALSFEKREHSSLKNNFDENTLNILGEKLIPLCLPFVAFCQLKNCVDKIPLCEELIMSYHIAKQLYDDLSDIKDDILKPDLSYLIKVCCSGNPSGKNSLNSVLEIMYNSGIDYKTIELIDYHTIRAENIAHKLNFMLFIREIKNLRMLAHNYKRIVLR
ncbi:MAG: hypothetical protein M0P71_09225 [Melioribacteraceae bacterium]|nr:hypothetical protein [Melioribacteraceae bacterium]